MHACNPVYIVYTHENIVNEFFKKEEMKEKEKRNYNDILYVPFSLMNESPYLNKLCLFKINFSGSPLENSNFSNSHRKIPDPPPIPVTDLLILVDINFWHSLLAAVEITSQHCTEIFLSIGQPHEGSSYAPQKDLLLAYHRVDHIRSRLSDLERLTAEPVAHRQQLTQSDLLQMSEQH